MGLFLVMLMLTALGRFLTLFGLASPEEILFLLVNSTPPPPLPLILFKFYLIVEEAGGTDYFFILLLMSQGRGGKRGFELWGLSIQQACMSLFNKHEWTKVVS